MDRTNILKKKLTVFFISVMLAITTVLPVAYMNGAFAASKVPSKVTVSSVKANAYNKVTVSWKKASNVTSYNVYYKESGATKWTKIANVGKSKTSYTHTNSTKYKLTPGKTYYYTVRGYNSSSKKSGSYNTAGLKVTIPGKPSKVTLSSVTASSDNSVTVKWKKATNATEYRVYYKVIGTKNWTKVATVSSSKASYTHTSSTKYPLAAGKTYYYTVRAYNKKAASLGSYNTTGLSVTMPATPAKVTMSSVKLTTDNNVNITWKKAKNVTEYRVYYKEKGTSKWTKIATVKSGTTSYIHTSSAKYPLTAGKTYCYTVRGYNSTSKKSGSYNKTGKSVTIPSVSVTTPEPTATPKPTETTKPEPTEAPKPTVTPKPTATPVPTKVPEPTATPKPTATPTPKPTANPDEMAKEVFRLTNIEREKAGVAPLIYNEDIQKVSMLRAKEISVKLSHNRPNGQDSSTAFYEFDICGSSGENIAAGFRTAEAVVEGWMNSPGHRAAMLRETNIHIGIGFYQAANGSYYWVQNFADEDPYQKGTITFDANGGKFADNTTNISYTAPAGKDFFIADAPIPTRDEYEFVCWMNKYGEKDLVSICFGTSEKISSFTAQWKKLE